MRYYFVLLQAQIAQMYVGHPCLCRGKVSCRDLPWEHKPNTSLLLMTELFHPNFSSHPCPLLPPRVYSALFAEKLSTNVVLSPGNLGVCKMSSGTFRKKVEEDIRQHDTLRSFVLRKVRNIRRAYFQGFHYLGNREGSLGSKLHRQSNWTVKNNIHKVCVQSNLG